MKFLMRSTVAQNLKYNITRGSAIPSSGTGSSRGFSSSSNRSFSSLLSSCLNQPLTVGRFLLYGGSWVLGGAVGQLLAQKNARACISTQKSKEASRSQSGDE